MIRIVLSLMVIFVVCTCAHSATPRTLPNIIRGCHFSGPYSSTDKCTGEDWARYEQWGFNVVRWNFKCDEGYEYVTTPPVGDAINCYSETINGLDEQLVFAKRHGIKIMLCPWIAVGRLAPNDAFWKGDATSIALWEHLGKFWEEVADRYKNEESIIIYDVCNEPAFLNNGISSWEGITGVDFQSTTEMEKKTERRSMMYERNDNDWFAVAHQVVTSCSANTTYTLKGYIKPESSASGNIRLWAKCKNADDEWDGDTQLSNSVDNESQTWQEVTKVFTSSENCAKIDARLYYQNAKGRAYFDNIILHKGDSINGNIVSNPGFEDAGTWWYHEGYASRVTEESFDGSYSGKITRSTPGYSEIAYEEENIQGDTEYTITAMIKAQNICGEGPRISVRCNQDTVTLANSTALYNTDYNWKYISSTFTTPVDCDKIKIVMRFHDTGTAYYDKVELYQGGPNLLANAGFDEDELWDDKLYPMLRDAVRKYDDEVYIAKEPVMARSMFTCTTKGDDSKVIYSSHFYYPHCFTHQGLYEYPYPTSYPDEEKGWNKSLLSEKLEHYREWLDYYNIPGNRFIMGEFGAQREQETTGIPSIGNGQWVADVVDLFETEDWHWLHLAYGFGWNGWNDTYWAGENTYSSKRAFGGQVGPQLEELLNITGKAKKINANGGFEYFDPDDNYHTRYFSYSSGCIAFSTTTYKKSGNYSLKIHRYSAGESFVYQWLDVVPGKKMSLKVWMRVNNLENGNGTQMKVEQYNSDGNIISPVNWNNTGWGTSTSFEQKGNEFYLDSEARKVKIILLLNGKGSAYFDDLEVLDGRF